MRIGVVGSILMILLFSCKNKKQGDSLFQLEENTGIDFQNNVEDGRLDNSFLFGIFIMAEEWQLAISIMMDCPIFSYFQSGANKLYLNKGQF